MVGNNSNPALTQNDPATLLWIGTRTDPEFRLIYQACEARCAQVAWRSDLPACMDRPASVVSHVLIVRQNRTEFPAELLQDV